MVTVWILFSFFIFLHRCASISCFQAVGKWVSEWVSEWVILFSDLKSILVYSYRMNLNLYLCLHLCLYLSLSRLWWCRRQAGWTWPSQVSPIGLLPASHCIYLYIANTIWRKTISLKLLGVNMWVRCTEVYVILLHWFFRAIFVETLHGGASQIVYCVCI